MRETIDELLTRLRENMVDMGVQDLMYMEIQLLALATEAEAMTVTEMRGDY